MKQIELLDDKITIQWQTASKDDFFAILSLVKELPDRKPSLKSTPKYWSVPAEPFHASEVIRLLQPKGFDIPQELKSLADQHKKVAKASRRLHSSRVIKGLRQYQLAAVDFLDEVAGRAIIGDDVGLGKTVEVLAWAWARRADIQRVLVLAPANVVYKWKAEIEKWTGWQGQVADKAKTALDPDIEVHIMSYDIYRRKLPEIMELEYQLLVLDEAHYIKNPKASRTRSVQYHVQNAAIPFIVGMSGTPLLNRPIELFTMLHLLDRRAWPDMRSYGFKYCGGVTERGMFMGVSNQEDLARRLKTIMVRRTKGEVRGQMPALTRVIVPVDVDLGEYRKVAKNVREAILALSPESKGYWTMVIDRMNLLRQAIGVAKADAAIQWAEDFLNSQDAKLLIYCHHLQVVENLQKALAKYGVLTIEGATSAKQRFERSSRFQSTADERVLIMTQAGREGIDLFGKGFDISNILFVEREWRPSDEEQAEGRLDREGQTLPVTAWYLAARGTIDEVLAEMVESKRSVITDIVGGDEVVTVVRDVMSRFLED